MRDFFSVFWQLFQNNREFRASYVKFVPFLVFSVCTISWFLCEKIRSKFSPPPHDRPLDPPLWLKVAKRSVRLACYIEYAV